MKRSGLHGDFWPTPIQEALLRVALLPDGAELWREHRPQIDVDHLPGELHRLLPLVARTLADAGLDDQDLPRLRGVRQYTWYRNQRLFADAAAVVEALHRAGIDVTLLRGAATVLRARGDVGLRPMNDLDLLVRESDREAAGRNLRADGWRAEAAPGPRRALDAAEAYTNGEGRRLVVHWRPTRNLPGDPVWWSSSGPEVQLASTPVATLDGTAHLVQVIVDGARALSGSTLRWIVDATALLRAEPVDGPHLVDVTDRLGIGPHLADALDYVGNTFAAPVPNGLVERLRGGRRPTRRERWAHHLSGTEVPRLGRLPELAGRQLRLTAHDPPAAVLASLPSFVQGVLGVDRPAAVPAVLARKAAVTLSGRGPETRLGPESARP